MTDSMQPPGGFNLTELNIFTSLRRYEEGAIKLAPQEIEAAVETAEEVVEWASLAI